MPQKHELEPVSTSTICWYSSIMRIYLHSFTTYKQPLQDSSSNSMLFRFFLFSEDTWDSSDHELFQIWVTWPTSLGKSMFAIRRINHESARYPGRWIFQRTRKWWIRRCKCWEILKILIWHLKNLELYQRKSWNEVQCWKDGFPWMFLMTVVRDVGNFCWKFWYLSICLLQVSDMNASTQIGRINKCFLELIQHIKIECLE